MPKIEQRDIRFKAVGGAQIADNLDLSSKSLTLPSTITANVVGNVTGNLTGTASAIADGTVSTSAKLATRVVTMDKLQVGFKSDAGVQASHSGFFETPAPVNYYTGAGSWQHLIESRHSNDGNNYALQIAGSFFDQSLWFRKTNNSPTTAWSKFVAEDANGNVGIGTSSPSFRLQLATDSAAKPSTNTWTIASDARIKENVRPYTKGLDAIAAINPVIYDYNGTAGFEKIKDNIGVIAQQIQEVVPEGVSSFMAKLNESDEQETELYNFNSHSLTYILINAVKELKAIVESQAAEISSLSQRLP
jgi:hypothetical protein